MQAGVFAVEAADFSRFPAPQAMPFCDAPHRAKPLSYAVHFTSVHKKLHHIEYVIFRFPLVEHIKTR